MQENIEMVNYFAYGSNLDTGQMENRGVFIYHVSKGKLPGYELIFPVFSEGRGCGVADVVPGEGEVLGAIYSLDLRGIERLDMYEGFYRREKVEVHTKEGVVDAFTYMVDMPVEEKKGRFIEPSKRYMKTIIEGAKQHGLDSEYVARLESICQSIE